MRVIVKQSAILLNQSQRKEEETLTRQNHHSVMTAFQMDATPHFEPTKKTQFCYCVAYTKWTN